MLEQIVPSRLPHEWETIGPALAPAIALDPSRDGWTVLDNALSGHWQFWRVGGSQRGYIVTERLNGCLWLIYAAGNGARLTDKRNLMRMLEQIGRESGCSEVRFEGRDWRKVFPDYDAHKGADGRWHYLKRIG